MKKNLIVVALLALASLSFAQIQFNSKDLNGKTVTNEIFSKNKVTMLNIWGTFCGPCIKEMPDLAKLSEINKSKGVEIVGIPIDLTDKNGNIKSKQKKDADTIIAGTGANYTHIVPSKEMMNGLLKNIQAVPTTIFVDKNGNQIGDVYMGARSLQDWQKIIDEILAKQN